MPLTAAFFPLPRYWQCWDCSPRLAGRPRLPSRHGCGTARGRSPVIYGRPSSAAPARCWQCRTEPDIYPRTDIRAFAGRNSRSSRRRSACNARQCRTYGTSALLLLRVSNLPGSAQPSRYRSSPTCGRESLGCTGTGSSRLMRFASTSGFI